MSNYVIETYGLTKQFGKQIGVNNLDLQVPKGKIYGLLGINGAGKTTTMQMLLNLVQPTKGKIKLFGKDYKKQPNDIYPKIGSLIESPGFYKNLTGFENLKLISKLREKSKNSKKNNKHVNKDENEVINALKLVGLDKENDKIFKNYSMGMKQRLGIAASIMHDPELLILDEPINGLDPIGIPEIRKFLLKICKEKKTTILISSHVLSEIEQIADIIGVMHEGSLIDEIKMDELDKINKKYVEFEVSDIYLASKILEEKFNTKKYGIYDENILRLYNCIEKIDEINQSFVRSNISVTKIYTDSEKLEEYFSKLIGGEKLD